MGPMYLDYNNWLITLTVITLSDFHCNTFFLGILIEWQSSENQMIDVFEISIKNLSSQFINGQFETIFFNIQSK